jgi:hypothetical protein
VLEEQRIGFDASVLGCPAYYLGKLAALAALRLRGRRSAAVIGSPRALWAPRAPYRPGRPWWRPGDRRLVELPVAVTRRARLPLIGASVTLGGPGLARALGRGCCDLPLVSLGLHALDWLDASDGLGDLARYQLDLGVPRARKEAALAAALSEIRRAGARFVTLADAAGELGPAGLDPAARREHELP